jgi:tetratricopeptide (TPR) repeat protein
MLYRTAPDEALSRLLQLAPAPRDAAIAAAVKADWPWDDLASAAMLETDAALAHLRRDDSASAPHLDAAERLLLRGLQGAPEQIAFATRWYRGVAAVLRVNGALTAAQAIDRRRWDLAIRQAQFGRALDVLASGIASEYAGCIQGDALAGDPRQFASAAQDFTDALTIDSALLEAALHLGRIRMLQGNMAEARTWFGRAAVSPSRSTAYLAQLFLGAIAERDSAWDEAERRYREAQSTLPVGQAAALALAALLDRRGFAAESASTIASMFERTALRPIADPWWAYFNGLGRDPDVNLRALRTEVSR